MSITGNPQCNGESESSAWSCHATADLRLINQRDGTKFSRKITHLFYSKVTRLFSVVSSGESNLLCRRTIGASVTIWAGMRCRTLRKATSRFANKDDLRSYGSYSFVLQDDCVIFEVKVNADAPHGVSWDRLEPFISGMPSLKKRIVEKIDLLENKHLLVQQEAHRLRGTQEPGRHLLHELTPSGAWTQR